MEIITRADQIESPNIRQIVAYWQSKCRAGAIPRRSDIDPAEMPTLLPNVILVDFERSPFRVKFRLVGTRVVEVTGFEFTGKYADEIAPADVGEAFMTCYRTASEMMQPVFSRITWRFDEDTTGDYDFCVLPLEEADGVATKAMVMECYARLEKQYIVTGR